MKLIRAEFQNFRLLRDLKLDFSTDLDKPLTVIRAENESGKTTILTALQWALYGDDALPGKASEYRLHPIDWDVRFAGNQVPISVQVDFEISHVKRTSKGLLPQIHRYRIVRSTYEIIKGDQFERQASTAQLFELTDSGSQPVEHPDARIRTLLPPELREVFFTDGDRALSFIEADVSKSTKRERVQRAIRSLLGLGVVENALHHVRKAASSVNKAVKKIGSADSLQKIAGRLDEIGEAIEQLEEKSEKAKLQFATFDEKLADVQRKIAEALIKGDREELERDIKREKQAINNLRKKKADAQKEHSKLFRSLSLSRDLLTPVIVEGLTKLDDLYDQGKIPNTTIPVLEERLKQTVCICGESLDPNDPNGKNRRHYIHTLIEESKKADQLQHRMTDLFYAAKPLQPQGVKREDRWVSKYEAIVEERDDIELQLAEHEKKLRALQAKLDSIPDVKIQRLREAERHFKEQRDRFQTEHAMCTAQIDMLKKESQKLEVERDRLLSKQKLGANLLAELAVIRDVEQVLHNTYERIAKEELKKVSQHMNKLFLEMIGADPDQGAIIQGTEISEEFDIIVYGPNKLTLDPDQDLNGASRRALTLAFILALTKVSEVEAPNVIDTPLGMMSGYVKQSVLNTAVRESAQLILFLTRSEIAGCEEILDQKAGSVVTLTNPAHYPKMLLNNPHVKERTLLRCDCDHRSECMRCQRRTSIETRAETPV